MSFISGLRAYIRLILAVIGLVLAVSIFHVGSLIAGYNEGRGFRYRLRFIKYLIWLLNLRISVSGNYTIENALFACNHRMMIDPVILLRFVSAYIVSKGEVAHYPVLGNGTKHTGVIFVTRESKDSRRAIREEISKLFKLGKSVAIFPEGTVNVLPLTGTFYPGSFEIAAEAGIPVVPIALDYADTGLYWQSDESLLSHFLNAFSRKNINCFIHFCEPIFANDPLLLLEQTKTAIDRKLVNYRADKSTIISEK